MRTTTTVMTTSRAQQQSGQSANAAPCGAGCGAERDFILAFLLLSRSLGREGELPGEIIRRAKLEGYEPATVRAELVALVEVGDLVRDDGDEACCVPLFRLAEASTGAAVPAVSSSDALPALFDVGATPAA